MATPVISPPGVPPVPPLEEGQRLARAEFERRYDAMPEGTKAQLIEGVVYMGSPVSQDRHAGQHFDLVTWLGVYKANTPGVVGSAEGSVRLDQANEPQPDGFLFIEPGRGGQARVSADGYVEGAPEMVTEVAASSAHIDLHGKKEAYRRNGVREYIVWRVLDQAVDWFVLRQGKYDRLALGADGFYRSEVFPGLWLDPAALVRSDMATVLQVLQQGIASPQHAEFVARLRPAAGPGT